jgi:hypothetical protein
MLLLLFSQPGTPAATNKLRSALAHLRPYSAIQPIPGSPAQERRQLSGWIYTGIPAVGAGIVADASITEANDTLIATGAVGVTALLAVTEGDDSLASSTAVKVAGTASITEADDALAADVTVAGGPITVQANIAEADDTLSATGANSTPAETKVGGDDARVEVWTYRKAKKKADEVRKDLEEIREVAPALVERVELPPIPRTEHPDWQAYATSLLALESRLQALQADMVEMDDEEIILLSL